MDMTISIEVPTADASAGCLVGMHSYCGGAIYHGELDPYVAPTTPCRCACHA